MMNNVNDRKELISRLQNNILQWQGYRSHATSNHTKMGLGSVEKAFPNNVFPLGTVHELVCSNIEQATASCGLLSGMLSVLMQHGRVCLWISFTDHLFPSALAHFGVSADRVIFIRVSKDTEALWVMEEALKCAGLAAVVAEVRELNFKQSRRLQLAVEHSHVNGFVLRNYSKKIGSTICAARWQVRSLPSEPVDGMPGLGFPRWQVDLLKVKNGQPGSWTIEWAERAFRVIPDQYPFKMSKQKAG